MARPLREQLPEELLAAAGVEFARLGFHAVKLDGIARRAGVTKGALYFHFRGKMDVFLRALDRLETMREALCAGAPEEPLEGLRHLLIRRLDFHAQHPELRRLHWIVDTELVDEPVAAARDGVRADYRNLRGTLRHLLQSASRAGLVDLGDPAEEAFRLAACLEGTLSQHTASPDDVLLYWDTERLIDGWLQPILRRGRRRPPTDVSESPPEARTGGEFQPAF